jgi:protease I
MTSKLKGHKIAILATNGVEQVELVEPKEALTAAGAEVTVVSQKPGTIQGMNHDEKGDRIRVDRTLADCSPDEFDGLVLPGGVANPDYLRMDKNAVSFVKEFASSGKPIASICHGPWMLIEADLVRGKKVTSWPSLRTDLRNAGANWVDEPVVRDGAIVTSRKPDDLPVFNAAVVEMFAAAEVRQRA